MLNFLILITLVLFSHCCEALEVSSLSCLETLKPGERRELSVSIRNDKEEPQLVNFRIVDYWCNSEGEHFYEETSDSPRSNASWIILNTARETLGPGERKNIYFTVQTPNQVENEGSYWSVLLIEPSDPIQLAKDAPSGFQLEIKIRYAFHIVTNIGNGTPKLKILKKAITHIDDKPYLSIDVGNLGTLFLRPKLTLKLFNLQGKLEKTLTAAPERLYPNNSQRYFLPGDDLQGKKFKGFFLFDNGDNQLFGDTLELDFSQQI